MEHRYKIDFGVDVISKRNLISRKNGDCVFKTAATLSDMKMKENQGVIVNMIFNDIQPQLKQKIFNIEILKISKVNDNINANVKRRRAKRRAS